jgi:adenylate kinase family enzyme
VKDLIGVLNTDPVPRRVAVVGPCATGKTMLAVSLATHLGLVQVELDQLQWPRGAAFVGDGPFTTALEKATAGPAWVVEGSSVHPAISAAWCRADLLVWLDYRPAAILSRLVTEWFRVLVVGSWQPRTNRLTFLAYVLRKWRRGLVERARQRSELAALGPELAANDVTVLRLRSAAATRRAERGLISAGAASGR